MDKLHGHCLARAASVPATQRLNGSDVSRDRSQGLRTVGADEFPEATVLSQRLEVWILAGLEAVLRPEGNGCFQEFECGVRLALQGVGRSQGIANVFPLGLQLVSLLQKVSGGIQPAGIEFRHTE